MYIYCAFINTLSTHIKRVNLNILNTRRGQFYQNNLHKALYGHTHKGTCTHAHKMTVTETGY